MSTVKPILYRNLSISVVSIVIVAFIGSKLDRHENERMARFRDKSALYGRKLKPGEPPSWP